MSKTSKAQSKASNKYAAKAYERLYPFVQKGRKAEIQAAADTQGESLNDFIVKAIDERMERLKPIHLRPQYQTEEAKLAINNLKKQDQPD